MLYPAAVRDLLIELAAIGLFRARWTDRIHDEWIRNVLADRPDLTIAQLGRTRALMNAAVMDCLVEDYDDLVPGLVLPDPDDRHVLAAAVRARCDAIVTVNLKDFPAATLRPLGLEAIHPDAFVGAVLEDFPDVVAAAARRCRGRLKSPPRTAEAYLATLATQSLPRTAAALAARAAEI